VKAGNSILLLQGGQVYGSPWPSLSLSGTTMVRFLPSIDFYPVLPARPFLSLNATVKRFAVPNAKNIIITSIEMKISLQSAVLIVEMNSSLLAMGKPSAVKTASRSTGTGAISGVNLRPTRIGRKSIQQKSLCGDIKIT
jgi:hypothetical protein